jgi:hypothetical protein
VHHKKKQKKTSASQNKTKTKQTSASQNTFRTFNLPNLGIFLPKASAQLANTPLPNYAKHRQPVMTHARLCRKCQCRNNGGTGMACISITQAAVLPTTNAMIMQLRAMGCLCRPRCHQ